MAKKSKSKKATVEEPAKVKPDGVVFVTYMGLAPSATQRKGLDDRKSGLVASLINGWIQDGKTKDGSPISAADLRKRTVRGRAAVEVADKMAQAHVVAFAIQHLPPLVVGLEGGATVGIPGGVAAISDSEWAAVQAHPQVVKLKAVEDGRILDPAKTEALASTKDQNILVDLVHRTHCPRGLAWLHGRELARHATATDGKKVPMHRARVMAACKAKAQKMGVTLRG